MAASHVPAAGGCPDCSVDRIVPLRNGPGWTECIERGRRFQMIRCERRRGADDARRSDAVRASRSILQQKRGPLETSSGDTEPT